MHKITGYFEFLESILEKIKSSDENCLDEVNFKVEIEKEEKCFVSKLWDFIMQEQNNILLQSKIKLLLNRIYNIADSFISGYHYALEIFITEDSPFEGWSLSNYAELEFKNYEFFIGSINRMIQELEKIAKSIDIIDSIQHKEFPQFQAMTKIKECNVAFYAAVSSRKQSIKLLGKEYIISEVESYRYNCFKTRHERGKLVKKINIGNNYSLLTYKNYKGEDIEKKIKYEYSTEEIEKLPKELKELYAESELTNIIDTIIGIIESDSNSQIEKEYMYNSIFNIVKLCKQDYEGSRLFISILAGITVVNLCNDFIIDIIKDFFEKDLLRKLPALFLFEELITNDKLQANFKKFSLLELKKGHVNQLDIVLTEIGIIKKNAISELNPEIIIVPKDIKPFFEKIFNLIQNYRIRIHNNHDYRVIFSEVFKHFRVCDRSGNRIKDFNYIESTINLEKVVLRDYKFLYFERHESVVINSVFSWDGTTGEFIEEFKTLVNDRYFSINGTSSKEGVAKGLYKHFIIVNQKSKNFPEYVKLTSFVSSFSQKNI
ncbi:MAG: hypothetical protein AB7E36_00860 [Salinivirgaceae bacterium]